MKRLDQIGITGINLLEFCFPYHNLEEFRRRGFQVKNPPFQVLYDYWYAGGLPVVRSEVECLELMEFAVDEGLKMGVHYCSLENKHTGQVYQQNSNHTVSSLAYLSPKDYFLKTAKVFGADIPLVLATFQKKKISQYKHNKDYDFLEFHVSQISYLKKLNLEVGISSQIMEYRDGSKYFRELKIDLTGSEYFDVELV